MNSPHSQVIDDEGNSGKIFLKLSSKSELDQDYVGDSIFQLLSELVFVKGGWEGNECIYRTAGWPGWVISKSHFVSCL